MTIRYFPSVSINIKSGIPSVETSVSNIARDRKVSLLMTKYYGYIYEKFQTSVIWDYITTAV